MELKKCKIDVKDKNHHKGSSRGNLRHWGVNEQKCKSAGLMTREGTTCVWEGEHVSTERFLTKESLAD